MGNLHNNSSIGGIIELVQEYFKSFYTELKKYNDGIHILNEGVSEEDLSYFENKYKIYLPFYYREWLKINNGGELFAIPVGTTIAGILGNKPHEQGIPYLEDNFNTSKREGGMPNYLFIIAETCEGNVIGFDLNRTDRTDGVIVYWNHESGEIDEEWESFAEWLDEEMELGKMVVDYDGNEKEPTI